MAKFKVGDMVERVRGQTEELKVGEIYRVSEVFPNNYINVEGFIPDFTGRYWEENFEIAQNQSIINKSIMQNLKEKFIAAFLPEPEKTFRKAGITNGDGILTEDGQTIFLSYLLKKNQDDFKTTVVDQLVADEEKNK